MDFRASHTLRSRCSPAYRILLLSALAIVAFSAASGSEEDEWGKDPSPPIATAQTYPKSFLSGKITRLKEKANGLYRSKRYADAAKAYREIAALDSNDAAAPNDLALCYLKLGKKDSALESSREALRRADRSLAAPDTAAWSFPDLRARKSAYYTLDKLGGPMHEPKPGQCETWSALSQCAARYYVCAEQGGRPNEEGILRWSVLRVGVTSARALFTYDEVEVASQVMRPEMRDMEELGIDGVPESRQRWINRDSAVTLPLGEWLEGRDSVTHARVQRAISDCRVIHFDPCAGVVGLACGIQEAGGSDRIVIGEYYLVPVK
jgi:hypothetical protein